MQSGGDPSRRAVIAGAAGFAGAATLGVANGSWAAPSALRIKSDVATFSQDAKRVAVLEAAIKEMQDRSAKDATDPAGWLANADLHRVVCAPLGSPENDDPKQAHYGWWVWPWHRAYIWVTEQKIRAVSGDDGFCFPYWNWTNDRFIPAAFTRFGSPLAHAVRYTPMRPLEDAEVDFNPVLGVGALGVDHFQATDPDDIPHCIGGIVRPNAGNNYGRNRLEGGLGGPHPPVHSYVGGTFVETGTPRYGDMTVLATAGRDPAFFLHHGNLDRLWENWRQDPKHRATEPTDDAFLNHSFIFTWLDGSPIEVKMTDILDTKRLGFVYDYLQVFRPGTPPPSALAAQVARAAPLPPVATGRIMLPPVIAATPGGRSYLEIVGLQPPPGPITAVAVVRPANAPPGSPGLAVGTLALMMDSGDRVSWADERILFDITDAVKRYGGQEIALELVPQRLSAAPSEAFAPLSYTRLQIVAR
jgi:polyphenol oxidase